MVDHLGERSSPDSGKEEVQVESLPLASEEGLHYFQLDLEGPVGQTA